MRIFAILAVSSLFGQQLVELAHALTVEHVRCPEHGELLDIADSDGADPVSAGFSRAPADASSRHDHCAVDWLARFQLGTPAPTFEPPSVEASHASFTPAAPSRSFSLLSFAPKTSPPLA